MCSLRDSAWAVENGVRYTYDRTTPRLKDSGACRKERLLFLRSRFGWLTDLSRLDLVRGSLVSRRCHHHIFGSVGFAHRSLGLVIATIGPCQSGTAEEGCDTQCHDETK